MKSISVWVPCLDNDVQAPKNSKAAAKHKQTLVFDYHENASDHKEESNVEVEKKEMVWNITRWSNIVEIMHFFTKSFMSGFYKLDTSNWLYFTIKLIMQSCFFRFSKKEKRIRIEILKVFIYFENLLPISSSSKRMEWSLQGRNMW